MRQPANQNFAVWYCRRDIITSIEPYNYRRIWNCETLGPCFEYIMASLWEAAKISSWSNIVQFTVVLNNLPLMKMTAERYKEKKKQLLSKSLAEFPLSGDKQITKPSNHPSGFRFSNCFFRESRWGWLPICFLGVFKTRAGRYIEWRRVDWKRTRERNQFGSADHLGSHVTQLDGQFDL